MVIVGVENRVERKPLHKHSLIFLSTFLRQMIILSQLNVSTSSPVTLNKSVVSIFTQSYSYHMYTVQCCHGYSGVFNTYYSMSNSASLFVFFQRSTFVGSAWSFYLFIPATTANDLRLRRISIPDLIHYIIFLS